MYSDRLIDHFQNPRNVGELPPPARTVEVTNPACGDILRLSALVEEGRIAGVAYKVRGCAASIAAGSALTEQMLGRKLEELQEFRTTDIERALGGLPAESRHAAALCIDGLQALLK